MSEPAAPKLTVVIPTFQRREMLLELLRSLEAQDFALHRMEVYVIDNNSTDGTEAAVRKFSTLSPLTVKYVRTYFRGPSGSRNEGLKRAQGEIIGFIDSDCVATPRWASAGLEAFREGIGLVQGRTLPNPAHSRHILEKTIEVKCEGPLYETCNIFYRVDAARQAGGFSSAYDYFGEDTDLAWKVKRAGHASAFADEALVYHAVFPLTLRQWAFEPRHVSAWPYMVRTIPELRSHLFARFFLLRDTALFDLALAGVILSLTLHPALVGLVFPYIGVRYADSTRAGRPWRRLARAVGGFPRGLIICVFLAYGSLRHRSIVL